MILYKLSNKYMVSPLGVSKVLNITNTSSTQGMKDLTIDRNCIIKLTPQLSTCSPTTAHIVYHWLTGLIM